MTGRVLSREDYRLQVFRPSRRWLRLVWTFGAWAWAASMIIGALR
jgi:hypothetical protein